MLVLIIVSPAPVLVVPLAAAAAAAMEAVLVKSVAELLEGAALKEEPVYTVERQRRTTR